MALTIYTLKLWLPIRSNTKGKVTNQAYEKQVLGMGKMQSVNFGSVDEFLEYLPNNEKEVVEVLRELVLESIPNCMEKLSYNVPFYYRHYRMCFIWPPAVLWGSKPIKGVEMGFCYGNLLNDDANYLERGTRKQVYMKTYQNVNEIDIDMIRSYLFDAVKVDDELFQDKLS